MSAAKAYMKQLVKVCRSLSEAEFDRHARKWNIKVPVNGWLPDARLIMMHKFRLNELKDHFTLQEQDISAKWLTENGYGLSNDEFGPRTKALEGKGN